jgi:hypothetical protein
MRAQALIVLVLAFAIILSASAGEGERPPNIKKENEKKTQTVSTGIHSLIPMALHLCASVDLDDPKTGGAVNYLSAPDLTAGGFICNVGPHFTRPQASEIDLAFPYRGGAVTQTQVGLRHVPSPLPGITDIEVPLDGTPTKLSYRLSAMPAEGDDKVFELYFYPTFPLPEGKATGSGRAQVRRIGNTLLFSFCANRSGAKQRQAQTESGTWQD